MKKTESYFQNNPADLPSKTAKFKGDKFEGGSL